MRRVVRFFSRILVVALLLGVPGSLAYLQLVGFGSEWRAKVARALGGSVYEVEIGRLTFRPFEGIVAENVSLLRRSAPVRQFAQLDRLVISPNLAELLRGRVSIDRLGLENARVEVPFADDGGTPDSVSVTGIRAELLSGSGQLTISRAECWVEGIHVTLRGHLRLPEAGGPARPSTPEKAASRAVVIRNVLSTLRRVHFAEAPELDVTVSGDLSKSDSLTADAVTLRAGGARFEELSFDRLSLAASYVNRVITLANLRAAGRTGAVQIAGGWNAATGEGHFDISGKLSPAPLLRLAGVGKLAEQAVFETPPVIEASVTASRGARGPSFAVLGQISADALRVKGVPVKNFATRFAWKDGRLYLQDAVLAARTGTVRAEVLAGPGEMRVKLASNADPTEFLRIFGPKEQEIVKLLEFKDPPEITLSLTGTRPSLDAMAGAGHIKLGRSAMRDSWIDSGASDVVIADRAVLYRNLTINKGRLRATGSFTYDFGRHEVRLDDIRTNINPPDILMWVDPRIAATVAVYRFQSPPDVRADGVAHMTDPSKNDLRIAVAAPGGLAYTLLNRDLIFGDVEAGVLLKGQKVFADVRRATLYGGRATVKATVSIAPDDPSFSADVAVERVDFPSMTKLYFGYSKSDGVMSGKYGFTANLRDPSKMRGSGSIRVEDGHVLSIPLFGPLSVIIGTIIPGAGHESARLATADFTIADGRIRTKNLDIQGAGFELFGDGSVGFPSGKMDLTVRINARGIPGLVLFPVSKLLEYVSVGTVSDPQWRPKVIPREFFNVLGMGGSEPDAGDAGNASPPARPSSGGKAR